jgi:hypothetical protein
MSASQSLSGAIYTNLYPQLKAVTPSDTKNLDGNTANTALLENTKVEGSLYDIYVGNISGGAAIKVLDDYGNAVTFNNVIPGTWLRIACTQVFATGTTATNLIAGK